MNRRNFLRMMVGGIAATAAAEVIPLGRVWSFPSKIIIPKNYATYIVGRDAVITRYADFVNMSDYALFDSIRSELSYRMAATVDEIIMRANKEQASV